MVKTSFLWTALATTLVALTQTVLADDQVISLTEKTFKDEVLGEPLMLVEFFAPWCGHCKALAPEYEEAATQLKESNIKLAKVDCTEHQDLCQEYDVRGYPTLKVFREGAPTDYKGARKASGIVSYMKKQAAPAVSELNADNFDQFKDSDRVVVIAYATDEKSKTKFKELAEKLRDDFLFGIITDEKLAKQHGVKQMPAVTLYKQFDEGKNEHVGELDRDKLEEFIKANSVPLLDEIDATNFPYYAETGLPLSYLFVESDEDLASLRPAVEALAKEYKGKINFVHINAVKYASHASTLGLKDKFPAFAIQHVETGAKFPLDQSLKVTKDNLAKFLKDYSAGKIEPTLKSEDIPSDNNGPVKVVVGKQYTDIVLDKSKDVFLEVYAPWCGHCKRLAPTWTELGELVQEQGDGSLVIAKLDGTENDLPEAAGFSVQGFPTLKFIKAGTNEVIDYTGDRSMESLISFIKENSSKKLHIKPKQDGEKKEEQEDAGHDEL